MPTFTSDYDEYIWSGSFESGVVRAAGDDAVGWFAPVTLVSGMEADDWALAHYGHPFLVLHERGDAVTVIAFEDEWRRSQRVAELEHVILMRDAGVTDADLQQAITGYRRALEWDAGHDGKGYSWDERAEWASNDDVTRFVCANADDLRTYMQVTGQSFEAVGGDFAFTRNDSTTARMGGFQNWAGGQTVDDLVAAARHYGPVSVIVNEKQELEVLRGAEDR